MTFGVYPYQGLVDLVARGVVTSKTGQIPRDQIQPASIDLRLGFTATRVRASFLPGAASTVEEKLQTFALHSFPLNAGAVLEVGAVYLVPLLETLQLPADVSGTTNAKSSTGRLDVFVRIITDQGVGFDQIPAGYQGDLYAEISPRTFPVLVNPGARLAQLRLRRGDATMSDEELFGEHAKTSLTDKAVPSFRGGLEVSVGLSADGFNAFGYRARRHTPLIDLDKLDHYDLRDFWEPLTYAGERMDHIILDPDAFYILASRECLAVPPGLCAEMVPFSPTVGEFRVHYAGFFDPGFGYGADGKPFARAVLEVRTHTLPFALEDGQTVARLVYERLQEVPECLYGERINSNYQGQGLRLSKHFHL